MYNLDSKTNHIDSNYSSTSKCMVCGDSLVSHRIRIENSNATRNFPLKNNEICYSKIQKIILKGKGDENSGLNIYQRRFNENTENAKIPLVTTVCHVKHNNICVKYIITKLPLQDKLSTKQKEHLLNLKSASLCYLFSRQKYKHIFSKTNQVPKFDGCRPLIVSLECNCNSRLKMDLKKLKSNTVFNNNNLSSRCACEGVDCNQDDISKKNRHEENLYFNGYKEDRNSYNSDKNKESFCSLLLRR